MLISPSLSATTASAFPRDAEWPACAPEIGCNRASCFPFRHEDPQLFVFLGRPRLF